MSRRNCGRGHAFAPAAPASASPAQADAVGKAADGFSVYFDTHDRTLRDAGLSLRLRQIESRMRQTVKASTHGTDRFSRYSRTEWESDIDGGQPDKSLLIGTPAEKIIRLQALEPVFETRFERMTRGFSEQDSELEISIDRGEVLAGGRVAPICEIEIENKAGDPRRVFDTAIALCQDVPLRLLLQSKSERGYALTERYDSGFYKAKAPSLSPKMPASLAFRIVGHECLRHLSVNVDALLLDLEKDALHQVRVAIRRLRAAMSLFRTILRDPQSLELKTKLKGMADSLSDARIIEVFAAELAQIFESNKEEPGFRALRACLDAHKDAAYRQAKTEIASAEFHRSVFEVARWLVAADWLAVGAEKFEAALERPVRKLAAKELSRHFEAVVEILSQVPDARYCGSPRFAAQGEEAALCLRVLRRFVRSDAAAKGVALASDRDADDTGQLQRSDSAARDRPAPRAMFKRFRESGRARLVGGRLRERTTCDESGVSARVWGEIVQTCR